MKKKKLQLKELKVKSFVTTLSKKEKENIQGGAEARRRKDVLHYWTVIDPKQYGHLLD